MSVSAPPTPVISIVGVPTVESRPPDNLYNGQPYTAVNIGLVETTDPGIGKEYDEAVQKAVRDGWQLIRQVHHDFQQTPRFKALANLEHQHRQAADQVRQLQQKIAAAEKDIQAKANNGSLTLDDQTRLRRLESDLDNLQVTQHRIGQALDQARQWYRAAVKEAVEAVRQKIIADSTRDYNKARDQLAGAVIANGIGLATAQAIQLRFGGLWHQDDWAKVPTV
jgi:hypothetical protein